MGYFSCNAESAIATCGSYELLTKRTRKKAAAGERPGEITEFDFSDLHAATNGFSSENLLGKGSYGSVYRANLHQIKLVAAVKKTKQNHNAGGGGGCAADNEVEILSGICHPRVVNLLGFGFDLDRRKLVVVEYMPNGSLYDLLHGPGKPPGWVARTRFAVQVARAVHFLHSSNPPVIHRDIKSSNVLIDSDFSCRVSDFGLALRGHVEDVRVRSTPPAGTLGYLDPGYLTPGDLSPKSDVFSFGILLLEIISGRNAIDVNYSPPSVIEWAVPAIKSGDISGICDPRIEPPRDIESLRRMASLAARCVRSTAEKRPGMAEALGCLQSAYKRIKQQPRMRAALGRRVRCVAGGSRDSEYQPLDDSVDLAKTTRTNSRKNGKVSSAASAAPTSDVIGGRVGRSKSIGTASEIKLMPTDSVRRVGLAMSMTMVRLRKSRSMGNRTCTRKLEESTLLVDSEENSKEKECSERNP